MLHHRRIEWLSHFVFGAFNRTLQVTRLDRRENGVYGLLRAISIKRSTCGKPHLITKVTGTALRFRQARIAFAQEDPKSVICQHDVPVLNVALNGRLRTNFTGVTNLK